MRGPNVDDTSRDEDEPGDATIALDARPAEEVATSL